MKAILVTINTWIYGKIKIYAQERDISVRDAIRIALNEFFRDKPGV